MTQPRALVTALAVATGLLAAGAATLLLTSRPETPSSEVNAVVPETVQAQPTVANDEPVDCSTLVEQAAENTEYYFLEFCQYALGRSCSTDRDCGPFPCQDNTCLVTACQSDADCANAACGADGSNVPGFCVPKRP